MLFTVLDELFLEILDVDSGSSLHEGGSCLGFLVGIVASAEPKLGRLPFGLLTAKDCPRGRDTGADDWTGLLGSIDARACLITNNRLLAFSNFSSASTCCFFGGVGSQSTASEEQEAEVMEAFDQSRFSLPSPD